MTQNPFSIFSVLSVNWHSLRHNWKKYRLNARVHNLFSFSTMVFSVKPPITCIILTLGYSKPFNIRVHTDATEGLSSPAEASNRGFCFNYVQQPCNAATGKWFHVIFGLFLHLAAPKTLSNFFAGFSKPFQIRVHTDGAEGTSSPAESTNRGFCFNYVQQPCNSSTG